MLIGLKWLCCNTAGIDLYIRKSEVAVLQDSSIDFYVDRSEVVIS